MRKSTMLLALTLLVAALTVGCSDQSEVAGPQMDLSRVTTAAFGAMHSLFVLDDGSAWAVGLNSHYQLGIQNSSNRLQTLSNGDKYTYQPVQVLQDVQQVAAGDHFSLFLKTDGTLWAAGHRNSLWSSPVMAGDQSAEYPESMLPTKIMQNVAQIAAGRRHALIVKTDGSLWGLGANTHGELGISQNAVKTSVPLAETTEIISQGVAEVFAGPYDSFILMQDGRLLSCGVGALGYPLSPQEGGLDRKSVNYPPKAVLRDIAKVASGETQTLFLNKQGVLYKSNLYGSIQPIEIMTNVQDVAATDDWFMVLKQDGALLNNALVEIGSNVDRIFAGSKQWLTITADGQAELQGDNAYEQQLRPEGE
jgi:alpha-tubulin suppressor-like RCC1 family protein